MSRDNWYPTDRLIDDRGGVKRDGRWMTERPFQLSDNGRGHIGVTSSRECQQGRGDGKGARKKFRRNKIFNWEPGTATEWASGRDRALDANCCVKNRSFRP
jgi:hypothetical protein